MNNENKPYSIYVIRNNINDRVYVGQTTNMNDRWSAHMAPSASKAQPNQELYMDMDRFGRNNFWYEVIDTCESQSEADDLEELWIAKLDGYNVGYNRTRRTNGREHSEQWKAEHSKKMSGEGNPNYGKHWSEDFKNEMSKKITGKMAGAKHNLAKAVVCVETGDVFGYLREAGAWCGLSSGQRIGIACRDHSRTAGNYHWMFLEDYLRKEE